MNRKRYWRRTSISLLFLCAVGWVLSDSWSPCVILWCGQERVVVELDRGNVWMAVVMPGSGATEEWAWPGVTISGRREERAGSASEQFAMDMRTAFDPDYPPESGYRSGELWVGARRLWTEHHAAQLWHYGWEVRVHFIVVTLVCLIGVFLALRGARSGGRGGR